MYFSAIVGYQMRRLGITTARSFNAACRTEVIVLIQKNDTLGLLSSRTLKCSCTVAHQTICLYHVVIA